MAHDLAGRHLRTAAWLERASIAVSHLTAVTALKQIDPEFESVSASLKVPAYRTFFRVTLPVCAPAALDISVYFFVNAMTTVAAVVFLYGPDTTLAAVAVLNMDDAGDIAPAAAMAMMIVYTSVAVKLLHWLLTRGIAARAYRCCLSLGKRLRRRSQRVNPERYAARLPRQRVV